MKLNPKWHGKQLRSGNGILGVIDKNGEISARFVEYDGSVQDFSKLFEGSLVWLNGMGAQQIYLRVNDKTIGSVWISKSEKETRLFLGLWNEKVVQNGQKFICASWCDDKFWKMNDTIEEAKRALEEHFGITR